MIVGAKTSCLGDLALSNHGLLPKEEIKYIYFVLLSCNPCNLPNVPPPPIETAWVTKNLCHFRHLTDQSIPVEHFLPDR